MHATDGLAIAAWLVGAVSFLTAMLWLGREAVREEDRLAEDEARKRQQHRRRR